MLLKENMGRAGFLLPMPKIMLAGISWSLSVNGTTPADGDVITIKPGPDVMMGLRLLGLKAVGFIGRIDRLGMTGIICIICP